MKIIKKIQFLVLTLLISIALASCNVSIKEGTTPEDPVIKECLDICPECGKCMNALCSDPEHVDKCTGHNSEVPPLRQCTDICPICNNCMNALCSEDNHSTKCVGHTNAEPEVRQCGDICPICNHCMNALCSDPSHSTKCAGHVIPNPQTKKHLILDDDNTYGGSLDKTKYGPGAPYNGELDVENDEYYAVNDYYNSKCTDTRSIITNFSMYQQTMQYSDGLACALSIMYHDGVVNKSELNEYKLLKRYQTLNNCNLYTQKGSSASQLVSLFNSYGYEATNITSTFPSAMAARSEFFQNCIKNNQYLMIGYQYGIQYQWFLVIGDDNMGNESANDDAIILGNPNDCSDHYQDGYTVIGMRRLTQWLLKRQKSGKNAIVGESIVINAKTPFDLVKSDVDNIKNNPIVPERHLMFNLDGTYGGSLSASEYGNGNSVNMGDTLDHLTYNYHKFNDYYNMGDNGTRYLCSNYRAFIQTMASSCNMCSILSILNYYQHDWSNVHNNTYVKKRNSAIATSSRVYSDGTKVFAKVAQDDYNRQQEALVAIYCARRDYFLADANRAFNNYGGVGASSLYLVPDALGYSCSTKMAANFTSIMGGYGYYTTSQYESKGDSCMMFPTYAKFLSFVKGHLKKHEPISTGWNPIGGHWTAIFGFDDMGTASIYDDVIMIADSSDCSDHYVDGYTTYPAQQFYAQWYNGGGSTNQMFVVFPRK